MPATVTLSTTTLADSVTSSPNLVKLTSTSGVIPGMRLYVDRELMAVISLDVDPWVKVQRGVDGTHASRHSSTATVTIGRADQFYTTDPQGASPSEFMVSPHINVLNGNVWLAQGDAAPTAGAPVYRWWQNVTTTYGVGPLGVRQITQDPTSST